MVEIGLLLFFLLPFLQVIENTCKKRRDEKYLRAIVHKTKSKNLKYEHNERATILWTRSNTEKHTKDWWIVSISRKLIFYLFKLFKIMFVKVYRFNKL